MTERVEEIRRRMRKIGTVFIQDLNGYRVVPGQEEAASFLADAAWTLSGALAQAEREAEGYRENAAHVIGCLEAEMERLKGELCTAIQVSGGPTTPAATDAGPYDTVDRLWALVHQREAALARVRAALRTYGVHLVSCRSHHAEVSMRDDCDCGLRAAQEGR